MTHRRTRAFRPRLTASLRGAARTGQPQPADGLDGLRAVGYVGPTTVIETDKGPLQRPDRRRLRLQSDAPQRVDKVPGSGPSTAYHVIAGNFDTS